MKLLDIGLFAIFIFCSNAFSLERRPIQKGLRQARVSDLVFRDGYPLVEHVLTTVTGNELRIYNIPNVKAKTPLILQNGISSIVDGLSAENNLPYVLNDAGFDVWMIEWDKGDFEEILVTEPNNLWTKMKSDLDIILGYIEEKQNYKRMFSNSNDVQVLDEILNKQKDVLNNVIINPQGRVIYVVFGNFVQLEQIRNDRNLVSKIKVFVNLKQPESQQCFVPSFLRNQVLIEPEWCSKTFEPKLRQVISDSICPSSKLNDEQCERLVSTLVNPDTLSKIVNEIVVTSLLKNVNTESKEKLESLVREILGTNAADILNKNIDTLVKFLKSGMQTSESNELITLLETLSTKLAESMRNCLENEYKTEFCNRILFWYINPQRITQIVELVNLLNNQTANDSLEFLEKFDDDDDDDDDEDDDDQEDELKLKVVMLERLNKHLHDLVTELFKKLHISLDKNVDEL
jgi:hypothetical protein